MIEPLRKDRQLFNDILATHGQDNNLRIWWLGQSGYYFFQSGADLIIDPYLSESLTVKYANTAKPHVRLTERVFSPEWLRHLHPTAVLATHHHTDHLDPETLLPLCHRDPVPPALLVAPKACRGLAAERAGIDPSDVIAMDDGEQVEIPGFQITAVPAAHEPPGRDVQGHCHCLGYVIRGDAVTVYHSGDTIVYDGMVERLRPFNVDLAILPINGKVGNMGGRDAARLAKDIGAKLVIPCHYEMFEFNTADPRDEFIPECERLGQPYKVLRAGERLTLQA